MIGQSGRERHWGNSRAGSEFSTEKKQQRMLRIETSSNQLGKMTLVTGSQKDWFLKETQAAAGALWVKVIYASPRE